MKRFLAITAFVAVSATIAGYAVHKAARFSDPLERAVALVLQERPEPVAALEGGMDLSSLPTDYSRTTEAWIFATKLTWVGLFLGGIPLAILGRVVERRSARTASRQRRSIFGLQAAFVFQLCSLIVTLLVAALLVGDAWPIRTVYPELVVGGAILALSATANILGIRAWTRIRVRATGWPHAMKIGDAAPQG